MSTRKAVPEAMRLNYIELWRTLEVTLTFATMRERKIDTMIKHQHIYQAAVKDSNLPWFFAAALHHMETGGSFQRHMHNGDPLTGRTVNVPKNRPVIGSPPFSFAASAHDALSMKGLLTKEPYTVIDLLYAAELYNGLWYRKKHINTPYLWSGTTHYTKGKYVADGKYDPNAVSSQIGVAVYLHGFALRAVWHGRYDIPIL
jgi:lysozyme family protein